MGRQIRTTLPQIKCHHEPKWLYLKKFRQLDKKYKSQQKRNYDTHHRARPLPELADDTPVWVRTENSQQRGRVVSTSDEPRSYDVSTPTGQVRRNRQHMVPIPLQTDVPTTESQLQRNQPSEFDCSPVQTRSQTGTTVHPPDRLTY